MLESFKGKGHCVTSDLVYIGDIIAQTFQNEWEISMVRIIQLNCTMQVLILSKHAME